MTSVIKDIEFYKALYQREKVRRIEIDNGLNVPIIILSGLVGLLYFVLSNFELVADQTWSRLGQVTAVLSMVSIVVALFFLIKAFNNWFFGFQYLALPHAQELRDYQKELTKYQELEDSDTEITFENYLIEKYVEYADNNSRTNDNRGENLYYSRVFIIISIILLLIDVIIYTKLIFFQHG